ncbi:MAG TPA: Eco57I restriction-modification methylase domain-containing protein, partial [Candidatus Wunengus sp. YC61]|uniref:Eco57I restriction-modification methylase domain-containing protein n=1 Tax=Candidatus Wunengus sp. YC61 TaxID=3367698 RepID=UPI004026B6C8
AKTGDVYCLFYERGYRLLKDGGMLTFITSNKWMRANYGRVMRNFFTGNGTILQLIDFGDSPIFENATTYTNVLVWKKDKQEVKTRVWDLSKAYASDVSLDDLLVQQGECEPLFNENSFVVVKSEQTAIKKRIEEIGVPLKDWNISIYRGILTGLNEAFIIDGKKKDELIAKDPKSAEIIKPILRGRDIKRYKAAFADLWLVATFPTLNLKIEDYPAIKKYLQGFGRKLYQTGEEFIDANGEKQKARKATSNKWFEVQDTIAYYPEFEKEKILYAEIVFDSAFHYDTNSFYPEATTFIVTGERLKYLTALLNSKLLTYAFRTFYAGGDLRGNTFRYKKVFIELLPVPKLSPESQTPFETLVNYILFCKERNLEQESGLFELVIDGMVYELYFPGEIKAADCEVLKHIAKLPEFKDDWSDGKKLAVIEKVYKELSDSKHPVSVAMAKMQEIAEIKLIEGKR